MEPTSGGCLGILALLVVLAIGGFFLVGDSETIFQDDPIVQEMPGMEAPQLLYVNEIEVQILESMPPQVNVVVRGDLPDPCTAIREISQDRFDNEIQVTIAVERDEADLCADVLVPVEEVIPLAGPFQSGEYTVTVNGVTETFTI